MLFRAACAALLARIPPAVAQHRAKIRKPAQNTLQPVLLNEHVNAMRINQLPAYIGFRLVLNTRVKKEGLFVLPAGLNPARHSERDRISYERIEKNFAASSLPVVDKLEAFPRFVSKRSVARFLCKYEIYKQILDINGVLVECGVFNGAGLFTWAQLANIFEPSNYTRKIIGFDTFGGFPHVNVKDENSDYNPEAGHLKGDKLESLISSIEKYNSERHLQHIANIELVAGDFLETAEEYIRHNPHLIIALLYLDFDLYEPTKKALDTFLPRMGKGSILCFDELNCSNFPGETLACLESLPMNLYEIKRFPIDPWISYIRL